MSAMALRVTSGDSVFSSMTLRSGLTMAPPLNPAIMVVRCSGSISIAMPRGGRPLVTANLMPALSSAATAAMARSVRTLSLVTTVPSTSASSSEILPLGCSAISALP